MEPRNLEAPTEGMIRRGAIVALLLTACGLLPSDLGVRADVRITKVADPAFAPVFSVRQDETLNLLVADMRLAAIRSLGKWPANAAYVSEKGDLILVSDADGTFVVRDGTTSARGPSQPIFDVLFVNDGGATRVIAHLDRRRPFELHLATGQEIVDLSMPNEPRQIAAFGNALLGQLDDGSILVGTTTGVGTNITTRIRSLRLDGSVREITTIQNGRAADLRRVPDLQVVLSTVSRAVIAMDLATGVRTEMGSYPVVGGFSARHLHTGFNTVAGDRIVGTDAPSFGPIEGLSNTFGAIGWSPDDKFLAVRTSGGRSVQGLRVLTEGIGAVLEVDVQAGSDLKFVGWIRT